MKKRLAYSLMLGLIVSVTACEGAIGEQALPPEVPDVETPDNINEPVREPVGAADLAPGRALRRLSAAQFNASLTVATGQEWSQYERYAAALGRADFAEITEEGVEFNVTFEKLVEDAARITCRQAIRADVNALGVSEGAEPVLLRFVTPSDRDPVLMRQNVEHLLLRFMGAADFVSGDTRVEPWMTLLTAPELDEESMPTELTDDFMQSRWTAVCVGLITHPDFLSY